MTFPYMLDTNICIYIIKQAPESVFKRFQQLSVGTLSMSIITYAELLYGIEKSQFRHRSRCLLDEIINLIPPLPLPINASEYYANIRASLEKNGSIIGNNDLWIAAHALAIDSTLVSNNLKEFSRVPNLKIENWVS